MYIIVSLNVLDNAKLDKYHIEEQIWLTVPLLYTNRRLNSGKMNITDRVYLFVVMLKNDCLLIIPYHMGGWGPNRYKIPYKLYRFLRAYGSCYSTYHVSHNRTMNCGLTLLIQPWHAMQGTDLRYIFTNSISTWFIQQYSVHESWNVLAFWLFPNWI